jgi:hypothetical protein
MNKPTTVVLLAGALQLLLFAGCQTGGRIGDRIGGARIDSLNVLTFPVAVNLDNRPGSDGFAIKLYAGNERQARALPITSGTLEVLLFDGVLRNAQEKPLKTWRFTGEQLKQYEIGTTIGTGYQLALPWEEHRPTRSRFSVVTRLQREGEPEIKSAPVDIEMAR